MEDPKKSPDMNFLPEGDEPTALPQPKPVTPEVPMMPIDPVTPPANVTPAPTPTPVSPAPSPAPEPMAIDPTIEPPTLVAPPQSAPKPSQPSEKKKLPLWIWGILALLFFGTITSIYYFVPWQTWFDRSDQEVNPLAEEDQFIPQDKFVPFVYRSSTFPQGILTINGDQARIAVKYLLPIEGYEYRLYYSTQDMPVTTSVMTEGALAGTFQGTDDEGGLIEPTFNPVEGLANYKTAAIVVADGNQGSVILQAPMQNGSEFMLPGNWVAATGGLAIKSKQGGADLEINFDSLPPLAAQGFNYEARLVSFTGPSIQQEKVLGRFDGTGSRTTFQTEVTESLLTYTDVVISIEPTWDASVTVFPVKPYSGKLQ